MAGEVCKRCNAEYDPEFGCYCNVVEFPKNVDEVASARPKPMPYPAMWVDGGAGLIPVFTAKRAQTMRVDPDAHLGAREQ